MSDIEQSSESIQAPIKRKYTRKPKVVIEPPVEPPVDNTDSPVEVPIKPKRTYTRKPKPELVYEPIHEPEPEPEKHEPEPEKYEPEPEPNKQKKPRSDKQIAAFNRMREARLKKQAELEDLKAFQKEKDLLEKEQAKIQKIEEKIVKKRQPKASKKQEVYDDSHEHIIQVSTHRPIMFV